MSATARALRTFCSTINTAVPWSAMRRTMASSSATMRGARPSEGSSSSRRDALGQPRKVGEGKPQPPRAFGRRHQPAAEFEVLRHRHLR